MHKGVTHVRRIGALAVLLLVLAPHIAYGQVVISELMYDPSGSDSDKEWVELFNAGASSVDLSKWKINDGSNHVLNVPPKNGGIGSIAIPSGGYVILAADALTFESAYPGVPNVIDTSLSFNNTGGMVLLIDDSGATADSVSYTKDLGASGDGNSLIRTDVSGTTLAAGAPTPGTGTLASSEQTAGTSQEATTTTKSTQTPSDQHTKTAPVDSYVPPPVPTLFADAGDDRTVIVGADTEFDARAYDRDQKTLTSGVRFTWNFGDGSTAEGENVLHHFSYPGRYAVFLSIARDQDSEMDMVVVTAEPAQLGFETFADGSAAIKNNSGHDLDLSGWIIRQFGISLVLPPHSLVLSGEMLRVPQATLGFWTSMDTELDYPNGVLALRPGAQTAAASSVPTSTPIVKATQIPVAKQAPAAVVSKAEEPHDDAVPDPLIESLLGESTDTVATSSQVAAVGVLGGSWVWWLTALLLALASSGAFVAARNAQKKEWDIVEEKG
jgi:hypothetical protein